MLALFQKLQLKANALSTILKRNGEPHRVQSMWYLYGMITHSNTYVDSIRLARIPNGKQFIVMSLLRPFARPRLSLSEAAAMSAALRRMIGSEVSGLPTRLPITVTVNQGSIEFSFPPRNRIVGTPAMWLAFCDEIDYAIATLRPH